MTLSWNRILSGLLAASYIIGGSVTGGAKGGFILAMFVILPLACIWFSDAMGGFTGLAIDIGITAQSPGIFVCIVGWLILLLPIIIMIINYAEA
jgi:hypothetical protein